MMLLKNKVVFDSSTLIAWYKKEKGFESIAHQISNSVISVVNFAEIVGVLVNKNIQHNHIKALIDDTIPKVLPFDEDIAFKAGLLIAETKKYDLSLGDRACIATALHYDLEVYTADKIWSKLDIKNLKLRLIR